MTASNRTGSCALKFGDRIPFVYIIEQDRCLSGFNCPVITDRNVPLLPRLPSPSRKNWLQLSIDATANDSFFSKSSISFVFDYRFCFVLAFLSVIYHIHSPIS